MIFGSCKNVNEENMISRSIVSGWFYKQVGRPLSGHATVPGTIHTDLLNEGKIEDPFFRTNEKDLQWIDKEDWVYSCELNITAEEVQKENLILCFEGLDTYADVYLNDSLVLQADNMFRQWDVNIKTLAKPGNNELKVYLHSPIKKGLELLEASPYTYPAVNDQSENGGIGDKKVSVFTRKAGYHYGRDWGPRFVTSGIFRPVVLKAWNQARIQHIFIQQQKVTKDEASLVAAVDIQADDAMLLTLALTDVANGNEIVRHPVELRPGQNHVEIPFNIENPLLWWTSGLGEPNLYTFGIKLLDGQKVVATQIQTTGLRSLKLIRENDEAGESFYFELNGVPVFAKGANYIPNDNFLPRVTTADYEKVIADAVDANMNMLRVWGGGIYENDIFYELCDKNGLLVWQDFMFACSMYPGNPDFLENVKQEAIDNVVRLRNHPCIALWCGNNEMNTAWSYFSEHGWGWKELYTKEQQVEIQKAYMDIFHDILPETVNQYTDGDDYWPSSPQAGIEVEKHAYYDNTGGDMHYWGVWHGKHPFEDFDKYKARFMNEYGFQSFPDFETVKKYTVPEDYDIESDVMASHQRSGIGNLRIKEYMGWYYKVPTDFEQFLYMSQVLQANGIKMAIEAHRRAMPYCMGSLYWQINDCWPVASWSSTDFYHKWKAMHYSARKAYQPILVSSLENTGVLQVYGVSDYLEDTTVLLDLSVVDFSGKLIREQSLQVILKKNTSTLLSEVKVEELIYGHNRNEVLLKMELKSGSMVLANNVFYFSKPKNLKLPEADVKTELVEKDGKRFLSVSSNSLAMSVYLGFTDQQITLSDNYFDLLPGETRLVEITAGSHQPDMAKLKVMTINQIQ